ncbi:MAG: hypothetical protein E6Q06_01945 [Candidatus Moraniibacteriota bacterium]|nr:MAG: hypothetical protein E6Q06_01945 [Candidatus Moranbacteria bacterium]
MQILDKLKLRYKTNRDIVYPNNSIPLIKGPPSYSYTGDGMDYRSLPAPAAELSQPRDWDPNISGKFNGSGLDARYTQAHFTANRDVVEERGDLGAGYVAPGQVFRCSGGSSGGGGGNTTVEQDVLYALIGSAIEQYIQNSILIWLLSVIGLLVWLVTIILIVQLAFPQFMPRQLTSMAAWQQIQQVNIQWWLILAILLTSLVGLNFPNIQNYLMVALGLWLVIWFAIRWQSPAAKNWIILAVGIILIFSGAIREFVDYSANIFFTTAMRWPSMLCCVLLLVDIFYVSRR